MVRVICWAWVANIKVVSLYEPKGNCVKLMHVILNKFDIKCGSI